MKSTQTYKTIRAHMNAATAILVVGLLWLLVPGIWSQWIEQSRWARDTLRLTPFYGVRVTDVRIEDDRRLSIGGYFYKRRCEFTDLIGFAAIGPGPMIVAAVDTSPEDHGDRFSRPHSDRAQAFGPWRIYSPIVDPDLIYLYARHSCPDGPQTNLFAVLPWAETSLLQTHGGP